MIQTLLAFGPGDCPGHSYGGCAQYAFSSWSPSGTILFIVIIIIVVTLVRRRGN